MATTAPAALASTDISPISRKVATVKWLEGLSRSSLPSMSQSKPANPAHPRSGRATTSVFQSSQNAHHSAPEKAVEGWGLFQPPIETRCTTLRPFASICAATSATQSKYSAPVAGPVISCSPVSGFCARLMENQISTLSPSSAACTSASSHCPQSA